jgi:hypothetical protein
MSKAFGINFIVISDVVQLLDPNIFKGGPWVHLATFTRGFKEYMAFKKFRNKEVYVEVIDPKEPGLLKIIKDDNEWKDAIAFLTDSKLLEVGCRKELKLDSSLFDWSNVKV